MGRMEKGICFIFSGRFDASMIAGTIEFTDLTMIEGEGNLSRIKEIMEAEGPPEWMLETNVTVVTETIASHFMLHLWHDGRAVITYTDHPMSIEAPDDDFRRLSEWSINNGWKLSIDDILLDNRRDLEFWMRLYQAAIIFSPILRKKEEDEMKRMQAAYDRDQNEDDEEISYVN
ncbi:hypothetical protein LCGC14_0997290 [marine sediment metagenome]|uniref:Uncharacterized protein n=1 Tax=marine sediment metagenome TaxID=412755 RepID=A0A0F9NQN0_9ZZZZ